MFGRPVVLLFLISNQLSVQTVGEGVGSMWQNWVYTVNSTLSSQEYS